MDTPNGYTDAPQKEGVMSAQAAASQDKKLSEQDYRSAVSAAILENFNAPDDLHHTWWIDLEAAVDRIARLRP